MESLDDYDDAAELINDFIELIWIKSEDFEESHPNVDSEDLFLFFFYGLVNAFYCDDCINTNVCDKDIEDFVKHVKNYLLEKGKINES